MPECGGGGGGGGVCVCAFSIFSLFFLLVFLFLFSLFFKHILWDSNYMDYSRTHSYLGS